ncbi:MAG: hypothetical protein Q9225_007103 [Loekoesia sp. 1 TL-2023]
MPGSASTATFDLHLETPPHRSHIITPHPDKATNEDPYDDLKITFNKTLEGHYRHGKTGYKRVGVLFVTWEEDDLQCKSTEVDALREFFAQELNYETDYFEIPKDRWQTALHRRISDMCHEFNSPDCLTIIYYAGHGYLGEETKSLKLAAKWAADASGDPTLFMNDVLSCCRLPTCDQLLILDCCRAANAFRHEHIGQRKFEMIVSSGWKDPSPAPQQPNSFTKSLNQVLKKLLQENKAGFVTSQLYREIYHHMESDVKPWLFDQARRDYGRIWLRPQPPDLSKGVESQKGGASLNLTLKLHEKPDSIAMNQLAQSLQYLPHIDQIRIEKLYAPKEQLEDFMLFVRRAAKLRPLIRKIHARRRLKELMALSQGERVLQRPLSFMKLYMDQKHSAACDWSSALDDYNPSPSSPASYQRKKSFTWPPAEVEPSGKGSTLSNRFFSVDYKFALPSASSIPGFSQLQRANTMASFSATMPKVKAKAKWNSSVNQDPPTELPGSRCMAETDRPWRASRESEEFWHVVMWLSICYALPCFWYFMKD